MPEIRSGEFQNWLSFSRNRRWTLLVTQKSSQSAHFALIVGTGQATEIQLQPVQVWLCEAKPVTSTNTNAGGKTANSQNTGRHDGSPHEYHTVPSTSNT